MSTAQDYSTQLLQVFERTLPVEWNDGGLPMMIPDRVEISHIQAFHSGFRDCYEGSLREGATDDLHNFGSSDDGIQTSGVGLADDFNQFVNLGLLCGSRVVLWDTVILGTFFPPDGKLNKDEIALRTCELLALKRVIEDGAIIMLPHPGTWLERCQRYLAAVADIPGLTPEFGGFLHSRALKDEGFELHPYTVSNSPGESRVTREAINRALSISRDGSKPLLDPRERKDEDAVADLIFDTRFDYLRGLDSWTLHSILSKPEIVGWKGEVAKKLRIPDYVESDGDRLEHLNAVKSTIIEGVATQNKGFGLEKANFVGAGVAGVGCAIGVAANPYDAAQILGVVGASIPFATAWIRLSRLFRDEKDDIPTIYQGFRLMEAAHREQEEANIY